MQGQWHFWLSSSDGVEITNTTNPQPTAPTVTTVANNNDNNDTPTTNMTRCQPFVTKLLSILEDENNRNLISWSLYGDFFRIYDCEEFSRVILPRYFRHCNWTSFVRQLNMYDFHKLSDTNFDLESWKANVNLISSINNIKNNTENNRTLSPWEFKHENFRRNATRDQLSQIRRKKPKDHSTLHIQYADTMRVIEQNGGMSSSSRRRSSNDSSGSSSLIVDRSTTTMSGLIPPSSHHSSNFPTNVSPIITTLPQQQQQQQQPQQQLQQPQQQQQFPTHSVMSITCFQNLENQLGHLNSSFDGLAEDLSELRSIVESQNKTISTMSDFMQKLSQTESRELLSHHYTTTSLPSTRSSNDIFYTTNGRVNDAAYDVSYQKPSYNKRQQQSPPIEMSESKNKVVEGLMRSRYYHNQGKQGINNNNNNIGGGEGGGRDDEKTAIHNTTRRFSSIAPSSNISSTSCSCSSSFPMECDFVSSFHRDGKESTTLGDDGLSKNNQGQRKRSNALTMLPTSSPSSFTPEEKKKRTCSSLSLDIDKEENGSSSSKKSNNNKGFSLEFILSKKVK